MSALPRYVSRVNPAAPGASRPSRKRSAPAADAKEGGKTSGASTSKRSKDREVSESTRAVPVGPSSAAVTEAKDREAVPDLPPPSPPRGPVAGSSSSPTRPSSSPHIAPSKIFPRGLVWEKGITEDLNVAFLPPGPFMDSRSLCPVDETTVHDVQKHLCKAIGLTQALLQLKEKYVLAEAERLRLKRAEKEITAGKKALEEAEATKKALSEAGVRLEALSAEVRAGKKAMEAAEASKKALEEAEAKLKTLSEERDVAQAAAGKATEELLLVRESLEKLASVKDALVAEQAAHQETNDMLAETARDSFEMALAQIQYLNPGVSLNLTGYDYRAYVLDGVLVPPPPSPAERSSREELADQGEAKARGSDAQEADSTEVQGTGAAAEVSAPADKA